MPHPSSHLSHLAPSTAIFSPSVARIAASTARDWATINAWLAARFPNRPPPAFERNPDTLRALLALASRNEAADEERDLLARAEAEALAEVNAATEKAGGPTLPEAVLGGVEAGLTKEGRVALDAVASVAVTLGVAHPEPEHLGQKIVDLQARALSLEQTVQRAEAVRRHLTAEAERIRDTIRELESEEYVPPPDLAKRNLELQRRIKAMVAKLPELRCKAAAASAVGGGGRVTVEHLAEDEVRYLASLAAKRELEDQLAAFQDLPTDMDSARAELEALRSELRALTRRRDAEFEGLVEAESPKKRRG